MVSEEGEKRWKVINAIMEVKWAEGFLGGVSNFPDQWNNESLAEGLQREANRLGDVATELEELLEEM